MGFYTSVELVGNRIAYRGYNDSGHPVRHKYEFEPTLYLPHKEETGFKSLEGLNLRPFTLDSPKELKDWVDSKEGLEGFKYYGSDKPIMQFIQEKFPNEVEFKKDLINVVNFDIEVHSEDGFPVPDEAAHPIVAITTKSSKSSVYQVWGLKDYDVSQSPHKHLIIQYHKCESEVELLVKFLQWWKKDYPDVITGWNIRFFDVPYIVNRLYRLGSEEAVKSLSPWGQVRQKNIQFQKRNMDSYVLLGINQMDYYDLFTKFGYSYGPQESYKLDHIGHIVLGEKKLSYEEYGTLRNLYQENHQLYIDYNIKDVELVDRIDEKLDLMGLGFTIAYKAGVNYNDIFGTTAIWDSIVYRELMKKNIVVPSMRDRKTLANLNTKFAGGYVKEVNPGMYDWVVSFDLASLYPNIIAQWNMSPETLLKIPGSQLPSGPEYYLNHDIDQSALDRNTSVSANGTMYDNSKRGVLPEIIVKYYSERKEVKNKMIEAMKKSQSEGSSKEIEREISQHQNRQMAIKILMNSLFGAVGNRWYRHFDLRIAEAITLTGQFVIKWCERAINKEINKILGTENQDFVIAIDTDSCYVNFKPIVEKFNPKDPVKFLDRICSDHFDPMFEKSMEDLFSHMNCFDRRMSMEREVISDRGIWAAKKRYILNVHNSEGVQYEKPKLKIMGIEAIKSSTPEIVRGWMREIFPVIMNGTEKEVQDYIKECKIKFKSLRPDQIAAPRGAKEITKWIDKNTFYKKGCPIHVRGAIVYNKLLTDFNLESQYEKIKDGAKLKYMYMRMPNPTKENVISFPDYFPPEFKMEKYIDYDLQFTKAFLDPLQLILESVGWESEEKEEKATLDDFFC